MTEVWKSNPKKFCDICKCWFADNRVSIQFHENGERHKANVINKIREVSKKGAERIKEEKSKNAMLAKMERAAMEAYHKDLAALAAESSASTSEEESIRLHPHQTAWAEAFTEDGHQYFWNIETEESRWEVPEEGFMSASEYQKLVEAYNTASVTVAPSTERAEPQPVEPSPKMLRGNAKAAKRVNSQMQSSQSKRPACGDRKFVKPKSHERSTTEAPSSADAEKDSDSPEKDEEKERKPPKSSHPVYAAPQIGQWTPVVVEKPETEVDWGIPSLKSSATAASTVAVPSIPLPEEKVQAVKFKEKTVKIGKLGDATKNAPASFKKLTASKRNIKKRDISDDTDSDD